MTKELEALKRILNYWVIFDEEKDDCKQIKDILPQSSQIVETELKKNQKTIDKLSNEIKHLKATNRRNERKLKALEIIKSFIYFDIIEVQGQWYLIQGTSFDKSLKLPITKEQAKLLKEVLL